MEVFSNCPFCFSERSRCETSPFVMQQLVGNCTFRPQGLEKCNELEEQLLILCGFFCAGLEEKHVIQLLKFQPFLAYLSMAYTCVSDTALFAFSGTDLLHLNLRETQVAGYS